MRRTSIASLALTVLVTAAIMVLVLVALANRRQYLPAIPWLEWVTVLLLAAGTMRMGWAVRAYLNGKRPDLTALRAARTLALAKAAALTGAILLGRYLATALAAAGDWAIPAQRERVIAALIAAVCALALTIAGLIAERWCQLPPPDDKLEAPVNARQVPEPS